MRDVTLPRAVLSRLNFLIVDIHPTRSGLKKSHEQIKKRAFAAAGAAHHTDALAATDGQIDALQNHWCFCCVSETHILKADLPRERNRFDFAHGNPRMVRHALVEVLEAICDSPP